MKTQFSLTTFAVSFGLLAVHLTNQIGVKADIAGGQEEGEIQVNIRNLFDSITKNDNRNAGAYRNILEGEAVKERQAFDAAKEEFRFARENAQKQRSDLKMNGKVDEERPVIKRETKAVNESDKSMISTEAFYSSEVERCANAANAAISPEEYNGEFASSADPLTYDPFTESYEYNFTTPKKRYTVTTTLSPAQFASSVDQLGVTGAARKRMLELHKQATERNLKDYVESCASDFHHILSYLEQTYMSREYVSRHSFVQEAREKLIDEKLAQILAPENDRRLARLQHMYNRSVGSPKRLKRFRIMLNDTISPLYHTRRQYQFELFLTWLLEPSMKWTTDHKATENLFALHHELQMAVQNGMKVEDFIKCVMAHDEKYNNVAEQFSPEDFAAAYNEIARMDTVYSKLMHIELTTNEQKKRAYVDAVYRDDKVRYCSAMLRKVYIYIQPSVPQLPEVFEGHIGENEYVELPDEIFQWEKEPHQL